MRHYLTSQWRFHVPHFISLKLVKAALFLLMIFIFLYNLTFFNIISRICQLKSFLPPWCALDLETWFWPNFFCFKTQNLKREFVWLKRVKVVSSVKFWCNFNRQSKQAIAYMNAKDNWVSGQTWVKSRMLRMLLTELPKMFRLPWEEDLIFFHFRQTSAQRWQHEFNSSVHTAALDQILVVGKSLKCISGVRMFNFVVKKKKKVGFA